MEARWVLRFGREAIAAPSPGARGSARAVRRSRCRSTSRSSTPTQNGKAGRHCCSEPGDLRPVDQRTRRSRDEAGRVGCARARSLARTSPCCWRRSCCSSHSTMRRMRRVSLTIAANTLRVLDETGVGGPGPAEVDRRLEGRRTAWRWVSWPGGTVWCSNRIPSPRRGKRARLDAEGEEVAGQVSPPAGRDRRALEGPVRGGQHRTSSAVAPRWWGTRFPLDESVLSEGLTPYADGWRASSKPAETLPHYPMVLHRGGYPTGVDPDPRAPGVAELGLEALDK